MIISYGFDNIDVCRPTVVTIGSFDGVHVGHRALLSELRLLAAKLNAESVVVTFDPHPRVAMGRAEDMGLLTTIQERAYMLGRAGIDRMVVAHFDESFRSQPYKVFVSDVLVAKLGMKGMIVGYNHRLGRGSEGNFETLKPLAQRCGFELRCVEQCLSMGEKVSSTVVRGVMRSGDMNHVAELIGSRYVVMGKALLGVLEVEPLKLLPPDGLYSVMLDEKEQPATVRIAGRRIIFDEPLSGDVVLQF